VNSLHKKLCDIAHHIKTIDELPEGDFDTLFASFERVMSAALERQLIGKYLSRLRKIDHGIAPKEGFETQL
jgi:hypothetical protein